MKKLNKKEINTLESAMLIIDALIESHGTESFEKHWNMMRAFIESEINENTTFPERSNKNE